MTLAALFAAALEAGCEIYRVGPAHETDVWSFRRDGGLLADYDPVGGHLYYDPEDDGIDMTPAEAWGAIQDAIQRRKSC